MLQNNAPPQNTILRTKGNFLQKGPAVCDKACGKGRIYLCEQTAFPEQGHFFRKGGKPELLQLLANSLRTDFLNQRRIGAESRPCFGVNRKAKLRGKAHTAQHPQGILLKALCRLPHAADHACGNILLPMEGVAKALLGVIGNGVHGKIAAEQILIQLFGEGDLVRMAAVGIFAVDAIGCDLIIFMMQDDGNRAMLDARIKGMVEDGLGFLGQGGGGDVPILRHAPQNGIADTAPDDIRFVTALIQFIQNPDRVLRNGNIQLLQGFSSFSEIFAFIIP